jgi:hypothetical protein
VCTCDRGVHMWSESACAGNLKGFKRALCVHVIWICVRGWSLDRCGSKDGRMGHQICKVVCSLLPNISHIPCHVAQVNNIQWQASSTCRRCGNSTICRWCSYEDHSFSTSTLVYPRVKYLDTHYSCYCFLMITIIVIIIIITIIVISLLLNFAAIIFSNVVNIVMFIIIVAVMIILSYIISRH